MNGNKVMCRTLVTVFFLIVVYNAVAQPNDLQTRLLSAFGNELKTGELGVGIRNLQTVETVFLNGNLRYPMQSVFKFPLAMAVLGQVDQKKLALGQKILIVPGDLLPDTWSPLREKYPRGNVYVTLDEILRYTVSESDNNGCDILFRLLGGTGVVDRYVKSLGVEGLEIVATEEEMSKAWNVQYTNWCYPSALLQLLNILYEGRALSPSSNEYLWRIMEETTTGAARLKGMLPPDARVAHKTGTSGTNTSGITAATNDIGIIRGARGGTFAIVVFVKDSAGSQEMREGLIARVARMSWDYFDAK